jgi:hypothetical protein
MMLVCQFWGGMHNGKELALPDAEILADGVSYVGRLAREELQGKPAFNGYLGPMWDGERYFGIDGKWHYMFERVERDMSVEIKGVLRYETQQVYDELSR